MMGAVVKGNVPELRFGGFFEDWSNSQLGGFGEFKNGVNADKTAYGSGTPFINLMDIFGENEIFEIELGKVEIPPKAIDNYKLLKGDILFVRSSVKREGVGQSCLINYSPVDTVFSGFIIRYREKESFLYHDYKKHCFLNRTIRSQILALATSSANTNINQESLEQVVLHYPSMSEQQKIAAFLGAVDDKMTALRRKRELLQEYKRGMMQKIFSRELRFKGDDGADFPDWEEKLVGDFMTESVLKGSKGDEARKITVKLWGKGVFEKNDKIQGSVNTQYYKRKSGQFIYSKLDFLNCAFGIIPGGLDGFESTVDLPCFDVKEGVNNLFILEYIKRKSFYKRYGDTADGSRKAKRVHANTFLNFPVTLPCSKEQQKIADFLSAIDSKIESIAGQIAQVETFKKGLLRKMFV